MELAEIISLTISILTLGGLIIGGYLTFRTPQEKIEKRQLLNDERDKGKATLIDKEKVEGKTNLIEEKLKWFQENNDKKFFQIETQIKDAFLLAANHTNTVDTKVDKLIARQDKVEIQLTKLSIIIEERMPCKKE